MLKNIIFDFGDVFINLDKQAMQQALEARNQKLEPMKTIALYNEQLEVGAISPESFISSVQELYPQLEKAEIKHIWNASLLDFPDYRLEFLEKLAAEKTYRLFLLSNTNAIHIPKVVDLMGQPRFTRFKNCFEQFYLSHEIQLRKPNFDCFEFVLRSNELVPAETLFVDDSKINTDAASQLGIQTWHLQVGQEDVTQLNSKW